MLFLDDLKSVYIALIESEWTWIAKVKVKLGNKLRISRSESDQANFKYPIMAQLKYTKWSHDLGKKCTRQVQILRGS